MKLKLVTVSFNPQTGAFPTEPLSEIPGEILSVVEHFFHHAGLPRLLLVVHHRPSSTDPSPARATRNPVEGLSEGQRELFERLRAWRRGRANTDGVPVYVVLNNRQLAEIVRRHPSTVDSLRKIDGVGEAKTRRYGHDILSVVKQFDESSQGGREPSTERN